MPDSLERYCVCYLEGVKAIPNNQNFHHIRGDPIAAYTMILAQ